MLQVKFWGSRGFGVLVFPGLKLGVCHRYIYIYIYNSAGLGPLSWLGSWCSGGNEWCVPQLKFRGFGNFRWGLGVQAVAIGACHSLKFRGFGNFRWGLGVQAVAIGACHSLKFRRFGNFRWGLGVQAVAIGACHS